MRRARQILCLLLAALLAAGLASPAMDAAGSIIFTAVNDTLLPLSDETMPFGSGGALYVASTAFDGTDLGIYYTRSRDRSSAVLYKQRSVIIFDLAAGTVETNNGQSFSGAAIVRGDMVFLPLDVMCRYFKLDYTYTRVNYGYLLRIKSESAVLSDAAFIDAASAPMAQRFNRYARTQAEPDVAPEDPPAESAGPAAPTTPPTPSSTPTPTPAPTPTARTVYPVVACTDPAVTEPLLDRFGVGRATYLFTPDDVGRADALLRRLACGDGAAALRVNAADGAADALAQIEAGNRALWAAASCKTRLVWLDGASEETLRRVAAAGYCPIRAALSLGAGASVSRMSARILSAADARRGSCCVFFGTDAEINGNLSALLVSLRSDNCTLARLNEVTAT